MSRRMNVCLLVLLFAASWVSAEPAKKVRLFILSGQSNMAGMKPEVSFTPAVKAAYPNDEVIVVKSAQGGQPIRRWYKKWKLPGGGDPNVRDLKPEVGDLYKVLMTKVNAALAGRKPDTVAFAWMQGERDAKMGWQSVYAESMNGLIKQLRDDLKHPGMVASIGRLSDCLNGKEGWDAVRAAQVKVAGDDPLVGWVDTDDLNNKGDRNDLHYTKEGYAELGKRYAAQLVKLLGAKGD